MLKSVVSNRDILPLEGYHLPEPKTSSGYHCTVSTIRSNYLKTYFLFTPSILMVAFSAALSVHN